MKLATTDDFDALGIEGTAKLLASLMEDIANNLKRAAHAMVWLRDQGCDVARFEEMLPRGDLRSIADGLILPEVWLKLSRKRTLMKAVSALPRDLQIRLVADSPMPVDVVERKPDGSTDVRKVAIESLPTELIPQVFDGSRLRPVAEQIAATMRPLTAPVPDEPDKEAWLVELEQLPGAIRTGTKREQKRAAARLRELAEKIALLVS